ncbi:hypothetical protein SGCZBJ_14995 [Caulobacter zeae]|uniref:DUF2793 domain-containing protein n=1 Tax=Caulobacter zeae TaxID=2055137 RepID=A0A2N5DD44_9CAUL|nr:hypothetical protein SGCZBJ_14995 [Caulobacter zeae]
MPVENLYSQFPSLAGMLLDGAKIYVGEPGKDPETNPQAVFWSVEGGAAVTQPLDFLGGYAARAGAPALFYTRAAYSLRLREASGAELLFIANLQKPIPFVTGPAAPVAGSTMQIDWIMEDNSKPVEALGGYWNSNTYAAVAFSKEFTDTLTDKDTPAIGVLSYVAQNYDNPLSDGVAVMGVAEAWAEHATVFGANFIASGQPTAVHARYVGMEVDVQPATGVQPADGSAGVYVNVFNASIPGAVLQSAGLGATFGDGVKLGGIATTGAGLSMQSEAETIGSLVNTTIGQFADCAIRLGNGVQRGLAFSAATGGKANIYTDGDFLIAACPPSGFAIKTVGGASTLVYVSAADGSVDIQAGGALKIAGLKVAGARQTGWTAMSGTAVKGGLNTESVTLPELARIVKALIDERFAAGGVGA